jgi:hypothetical protein
MIRVIDEYYFWYDQIFAPLPRNSVVLLKLIFCLDEFYLSTSYFNFSNYFIYFMLLYRKKSKKISVWLFFLVYLVSEKSGIDSAIDCILVAIEHT